MPDQFHPLKVACEAHDGAFATPETAQWYGQSGVTKREYFAALNHAAILGKMAFNQEAEDMLLKAGVKIEDFQSFAAHLAVEAADAMISELNRS